ncbi:hypothetical protein K456DRAFT_1592240 [Colletotrichum gloeosporioides 23]|nr:hypothetical protein K456DRAFT_1592240 [Colletotrichum gloeosporioides 23]
MIHPPPASMGPFACTSSGAGEVPGVFASCLFCSSHASFPRPGGMSWMGDGRRPTPRSRRLCRACDSGTRSSNQTRPKALDYHNYIPFSRHL